MRKGVVGRGGRQVSGGVGWWWNDIAAALVGFVRDKYSNLSSCQPRPRRAKAIRELRRWLAQSRRAKAAAWPRSPGDDGFVNRPFCGRLRTWRFRHQHREAARAAKPTDSDESDERAFQTSASAPVRRKHGSCQLPGASWNSRRLLSQEGEESDGFKEGEEGRARRSEAGDARRDTRAHQNREPDEHQRRFENCNAGWRRVSA